jgi:hypothetical protein
MVWKPRDSVARPSLRWMHPSASESEPEVTVTVMAPLARVVLPVLGVTRSQSSGGLVLLLLQGPLGPARGPHLFAALTQAAAVCHCSCVPP